MPVEVLENKGDTIWGFWKISEQEKELSAMLGDIEAVSPDITNPNKRLEFLASRVLLKTLLSRWNISYSGIVKDQAGKPYLKHNDLHISLSHSYPYVAAVVDRHRSVGIDLEQPKHKLLRIAGRILNPEEQENAGNDIVKHCIYWCAKEALVKIYGKKHLTFATELAVNPFQMQNKGIIVGRIIATDAAGTFPLHYRVYDNFVLVVNQC